MNIISKEPILKGWSGDKKYRVMADDGRVYLLRVSPPEKRERVIRQFHAMQRVDALGVPMCRPVELFETEEGIATLLSWIDGEDAEAAVPRLPGEKQYALGIRAGEILRKIHTIPAPEGIEAWGSFFGRKLDRKITMYETCPLKYDDIDAGAFFRYIAENRHLLDGRPQTYQHGDYHIGNMMLGRDGKLYIIDFDRDDAGDPWEEFNRIVWCAGASPLFASGMVDGYFGGQVPEEFWRLLALYISSNTLSSLPWAIPFGEEEIQVMRQQARDVMEWYRGMTEIVPRWYISP